MNINATIFVQIANFIVAYVLFEWLLFRPAVRIINQERSQENNILFLIEQEHALVIVKENERSHKWRVCQEYFLQHTPNVGGRKLYIFQNISPEFEVPDISESAIALLIDEVRDQLVERVAHGHK